MINRVFTFKDMIELDKCNKLIDDGFSLITVSNNKIPNFKWKQYQSTQVDKKKFEWYYNYKGGLINENTNKEIPPTENIGIVTGFDYLECIDVDLKVFSTAKEQKEFWDEYLSFLQDNILDFDEKFVIYKTKNAGYHILYKSKRVDGNKKIAVLKGHKEAVIETRGIGGYIFTYYGKNLFKTTYKDVKFVSDEDRNILWSCSKIYNHVEDVEIIIPKTDKKQYSQDGLTPWDDYNNQTSMIELLASDFDVVTNLSNKYVIRRKGADSPHSGYIFKDTNCMYLFSTATIFDAEKLYSPFTAFAKMYHNGDTSQAAKDLYLSGFGERLRPEPVINLKPIELNTEDVEFPIEVFPLELQRYMKLCHVTLNNSIDYMGCSLLFVSSIIIGNSTLVQVKRGWNETANLWLALVGRAGVGKTPSINSITFPLDNINNREIKKFIKDYDKFEKYIDLDKAEKQLSEEIKKPRKTQFIVNDITLEALVELHSENKNGIGVNKDELAGWFKDMNKYRQGSDLEHWLSSWSGKQINMNRKTAKSAFVERAFIPVLGGIQPSIMDGFYTDENKDSGFIDRMLFSYPELMPADYCEREMEQEHLDWYSDYIVSFYESVKKNINYTKDNEIEPSIIRFSKDANKEWIKIHNKIISHQKSDEENEYMKSMYPKQISYIPRFALIIHSLSCREDSKKDFNLVSKDSVIKAEMLSNYFVAMSKKIKGQSNIRNDIGYAISLMKGKSDYDKFKSVYSSNNNISKSVIADKLGISRQSVYNYIKKYEDETKVR